MISILPTMSTYNQNRIKSNQLVQPSMTLKADTFEKTTPSFKGREQYKLFMDVVEELTRLLSQGKEDTAKSTEIIQKAQVYHAFKGKWDAFLDVKRNICLDSTTDDSFLARRLMHDVDNKLTAPKCFVDPSKPVSPNMTLERYGGIVQGAFKSAEDLIKNYLSLIDGDSRSISEIVDLVSGSLNFDATCKGIIIKLPDYMERIGKYSKMKLVDKDGKPIKGIDLYNIVLNITQNAVKYSPKHSTVTIKFEEQTIKGQRFVAISVEDQGIGVRAEDVDGIFKGKRGKNAIESGIPGTGFGLQEIKRTMDAIGAEIHMTSPLNEANRENPGSRFTCLFRVQE